MSWMKFFVFLIVALGALFAHVRADEIADGEVMVTDSVMALDLDLIDAINAMSDVSWRADTNEVFVGRDIDFARALMGVKGFKTGNSLAETKSTNASDSDAVSFLSDIAIKLSPKSHAGDTTPIPESFDARAQWGAICPSLHEVRDQADCGSCWAVAFAAAATDRACIASGGSFTKSLSASDPLSCCKECGEGCGGGFLAEVWDYYVHSGVVTGGSYDDKSTCYPYQFPSCDSHGNASSELKTCSGNDKHAEQCPSRCHTSTFEWAKDKHYATDAYQLNTVADIQRDILKHGSVEAAFRVTSDFMAYRSGVYHSVPSEKNVELGGHAVKLLGWGVEAGVPYWLCVNSWRQSWGDLGTFKIKRGVNECGIEEQVFAGTPRV